MRYSILIIAILGCTSKGLNKPEEAAPWKQECFKGIHKNQEYCVSKTGYANPITVIDFHGLGDGVKSPKISTYDTSQRVKVVNELQAAYVVSISYGLAWMLKPGMGPESTGEVESMLEALIKEYQLPPKIVGIGMSMGGHNLLVTCLSSSLIKKCALLNPMILSKDQYSESFSSKSVKDASIMPGKHFSREEWAKYNPFSLIEGRGDMKGKFLVSSCKQDDFGLHEMTKKWAEVYGAKFLAHDCDHFHPNASGVVEFLNE